MKMQEVINASEEELQRRLGEAQREYLVWRDNVLSGKEQNYTALRTLKRDIARIKTVLRQRVAAAK